MPPSPPEGDAPATPGAPESLSDTLLRIGAAIASAHAATFQAMMLDLVQRDGDSDPQPVRDAVATAVLPGDPMGPARHVVDALRTTLATHADVAADLAQMAGDTSPLALLGAINGQDPAMIAASSYALDALRQTTEATAAAVCSLPGVDEIARAAASTEGGQEPDGAIAVARRARLATLLLAACMDDDGTVPMELAMTTRARTR